MANSNWHMTREELAVPNYVANAFTKMSTQLLERIAQGRFGASEAWQRQAALELGYRTQLKQLG